MREKLIFIINFVVIRKKMLGAHVFMFGASCLEWRRVDLNWWRVIFGFNGGDLSWGRVVLIRVIKIGAISNTGKGL